MSALDKNKIFFGLVHYILSEQHNVDWILKTSLVDFTGLNSSVTNKKYKQNSVSDDIIEYIYQVKPYHVQFEQFIEKYSSKQEFVNVDVKDTNNVDIDIRFDAISPDVDNYGKIIKETDDEIIEVGIVGNIHQVVKNNNIVIGYIDNYHVHNSDTLLGFVKDDKTAADFENNEIGTIEDYYHLAYDYKNNVIGYINKDNKVYDFNGVLIGQVTETEDMRLSFMDTHMANRLWLLKHEDFKTIYENDDEIKKYIEDVLNTHFKGVTIDGSGFEMTKYGYDAFLYEDNLYDSPTITATYCLVNLEEDLGYNYKKSFVKPGSKALLLDSEDNIQTGNVVVNSYYKGEKTELTVFNIENNLLTLFNKMKEFEKIEVIYTNESGVESYFIFVAHPFIESKDSEDGDIRKFVQLGTEIFDMPEGSLSSKTVVVHIEYPNGTRLPTLSFERIGNQLRIFDPLTENSKVVISIIDFGQVYDKIYTWEDAYGNSNSIVTLDGDEFLRPNYEAGRPSELVVTNPSDGLMIYTSNGKKLNSLYEINWKNDQYKMPISATMTTKLSKDLNFGDRIIEIDDMGKLLKPTINSVTKEIEPAKILINNEIIEYHEYEQVGKKGILKAIRRAAMGSLLNDKLSAGETVYAYNEQSKTSCSPTSSYISTLIKEDTGNIFLIPEDYKGDDKIYVAKVPLINLLTDITISNDYFEIDSENVCKPTEVILETKDNCGLVHRGQKINILVGSALYTINVTDDSTIDMLVSNIKNIIPSSSNVKVINNNGKLQIIAPNGQPIRLTNKEGNGVQEIINLVVYTNPVISEQSTIIMNGSNGLLVNKFPVIWGTYRYNSDYLKDNPIPAEPQDIVESINQSQANHLIKAVEREDGVIEIIQKTDEQIVFENLTDDADYYNNKEALGLPDKIEKQDVGYDSSSETLYWENVNPQELGYIFINGERLYFKNLQKVSKTKWRASNYFTDKEYKANDSIIVANVPEDLTSKDYKVIMEWTIVNQKTGITYTTTEQYKEPEHWRVYNKKYKELLGAFEYKDIDIEEELEEYKNNSDYVIFTADDCRVRQRAYITLNDKPKIDEVIIVGNEK